MSVQFEVTIKVTVNEANGKRVNPQAVALLLGKLASVPWVAVLLREWMTGE